MSVFTEIYNILNVAAITNIADDISPYVRGRGKGFPCVLYEIPTQIFDRTTGGAYRSVTEASIKCMDRTVAGAETLADAVLTVLNEVTCGMVDSIDREYEEGYDDDSVGMFTTTINFTLFSGVS